MEQWEQASFECGVEKWRMTDGESDNYQNDKLACVCVK